MNKKFLLRNIIGLLSIIIGHSIIAQNNADNFLFSNYSLGFSNNSVSIHFDYATHLNRGAGIISDDDGNLLLYTDGSSVWNKNHELMPNGTGLVPGAIESIIIKKPGAESEYYIFSVEPWNGQETAGLYYSEVNLTLQGGLGDVTSKGTKLLHQTTNKLSAVMHSNGQDVWILTHVHNTNHYYSYLITSEGISDTIENGIGQSHSYFFGQMKFSTDGKKVGVSHNYNSIDNTVFDLFDFDNSTGILSNSMSFELPASHRNCEGIEFSPDSKKLYVVQSGSSGESGLYQFDLTIPNFDAIDSSRYLLHREIHNGFRDMQLAPNGVIYITKGGGGGGTAHLGTISNTNEIGEHVVVEENGLYLNGGSSFVNYTPNFIQNYFYKTSFTYTNNCQYSNIFFKLTNEHLIDSVRWSFGEGRTSNLLNPEIQYEEPGEYDVCLLAYSSVKTDTIRKKITINPVPSFDLGRDTSICYGQKLSINERFVSYQWNTEDTNSYTYVNEEGLYKLMVENEFGCFSSDSVFVSVNELPIIELSDTMVLGNNDSIFLEAGDHESYYWSTGELTPSIYVSEEGWYSVAVNNEAGCQSVKSVYVSIDGENNNETEDEWIWLNPKPSGQSGKDMYFINERLGFIVKNKELLRTIDGGDNWEVLMKLTSGNRITFKNQIGYIIGNYGTIYKSTHNGEGWNKLNFNYSDDLNAITAVHQDTLYVTSDNKLFVSKNGGMSWMDYAIDGVNIEDSYFTSAIVGHIACTNGTIKKTIDGGQSWYTTESSNIIPSDFFRITFVTDSIGFATQEHDEIYKTTDGGESWNEITSLDAAYSINFIDKNIGFIAGEHGAIHKTVDGGSTWEWIGFDGRKYANDLYSIFFVDENFGFATGLRGRIIKTVDGGMSWKEYAVTYNDIRKVVCFDKDVYALYWNTILKSEDAGISWTKLPLQTDNRLYDIHFFGKDTAIISAGVGCLYKTYDGGNNWKTIKPVNRQNIESMYFIDRDTGFISGDMDGLDEFVYMTYDGGETWIEVLRYKESFDQLYFIDSKKGFGLRYGDLYQTLDGGVNWALIYEIYGSFNDMHFVNDSVGYIAADYGKVLKTTDGGLNWIELETDYDHLLSVGFYNESIGYVSGEYGSVFKTLDGGENWERVYLPAIINSIDINREGVVYVAGPYGAILKSVLDVSEIVNLSVEYISEITHNSAKINGKIESSLDNTVLMLEYGTGSEEYNSTLTVNSYNGYVNESISHGLTNLERATKYYCRLKVLDGDNEIVSPEVSFTTSMDTHIDYLSENNNLKVYPNPTSDYITIEFTKRSTPFSFQLFDMQGKVLFHENQSIKSKINLSGLKAGTYILIIKQNSEKLKLKVIKK